MRSSWMLWTTAVWLAGWSVADDRAGPADGAYRTVRGWQFPDHPTFRRFQWSPRGELRVTLATCDQQVSDPVDEGTVEAWVREPEKEQFFRRRIQEGYVVRDALPGSGRPEGGRSCRR